MKLLKMVPLLAVMLLLTACGSLAPNIASQDFALQGAFQSIQKGILIYADRKSADPDIVGILVRGEDVAYHAVEAFHKNAVEWRKAPETTKGTFELAADSLLASANSAIGFVAALLRKEGVVTEQTSAVIVPMAHCCDPANLLPEPEG